MTKGTSVRQLVQAYITPPQVIGIKKDVVLPTNMTVPTQSTRRSFDARLDGTKLSLRKRGIMTTEMPMNGRLT
jgi:hypothetical protein